MLLQIITHTPRWVFGLFVLLVWIGCKQLVSGSVSLVKVTVMPIAMTGLAIYGVASAFGASNAAGPAALLAWAAAAAALLAISIRQPLHANTRYDAEAREFNVAGSAVPLMLMMGIFFTKYVVGVSLAMHPELAHQTSVAVGVSALYGAFTGVFVGRAARLWKLAIRTDRGMASAA
ncbi:hypothetical protein BH11PSE13_BH11PSE13_16450 [soil metagenome]